MTSLKVDVQTQALMESLLDESIRIIDLKFGVGYSKKNPETVISLLQVFTRNLQISITPSLIEEKLQHITGRLDIIIDYIEK